MTLNNQARRLVRKNHAHDERSMVVHTLPGSEAWTDIHACQIEAGVLQLLLQEKTDKIFPLQQFKAQLWCKLPWWRHTSAVLQDGGFNVEVVQFGRIVSPVAFIPRGAPVDMRHSSELHANRADLGLLLEFEGDLSCDPVATEEGPALVIHVIIDVEVCYRLLEHYLKSIQCCGVD